MSTRKHLLDHQLKYCEEPQAVFQETETRKGQDIECFDLEYIQAAQKWASKNPHTPLPIGETLTLQGKTFQREEDKWIWRSESLEITLNPKTSKDSAERLLATINQAQPILKRRLVHNDKIRVLLGYSDRPCVAAALKNILMFPLTENGNILADALAESSKDSSKEKVTLSLIFLHELGHTLRTYLLYIREDMIARIGEEFFSCEKLLKEISPHYLGKQFNNTAARLASLQIRNSSPEQAEELAKLKISLTGEIFAEMVRHYYLEPLLLGEKRKTPPTKTKSITEFGNILQEELEGSLQHTHPKAFPIKEPPGEYDTFGGF